MAARRCEKCGLTTKHRWVGDEYCCEVCGTQGPPPKPRWPGYPGLSEEENEDIREARALGWAVFYPAFPSAKAQAEKTLRGARDFLERHHPEPVHFTEDDVKRATEG